MIPLILSIDTYWTEDVTVDEALESTLNRLVKSAHDALIAGLVEIHVCFHQH